MYMQNLNILFTAVLYSNGSGLIFENSLWLLTFDTRCLNGIHCKEYPWNIITKYIYKMWLTS